MGRVNETGAPFTGRKDISTGDRQRKGRSLTNVLLKPLPVALLASFVDLEPFSISGIELVA